MLASLGAITTISRYRRARQALCILQKQKTETLKLRSMMKLTFRKCLVLSLATGLMGLFLTLPDRGAAQAGAHAGAAAGITVGTFRGTYVTGFTGYTVDASGNHTPFGVAARETYFGNGHATGVSTTTTKDGVQSRVSFTGVYTINADGSTSETDTDEHGAVSHFDNYITRDGSTFGLVETDAGVIAAGVATRGSGSLERD